MIEPYNQTIEQIVKTVNSDPVTGLSVQEAQARLRQDGPNSVPLYCESGWVMLFVKQFFNPLVYLLLVAALIIFFIGQEYQDAFIITGVLLFNALVGALQEGRANAIVASLSTLASTECIVIRDGVRSVIAERELVVGDLIFVQEGQRVPADARVVLSHGLAIDESVLTGESGIQYKNSDPLDGVMSVAQQDNMIFGGTYVMAGNGYALVVATGTRTHIGAIKLSVSTLKTDVPLYHQMERLAYAILLGAVFLCVSLLIIGWLMGKPFNELFVMLTALFICIVPEGLPVVLILLLVTSADRLARKKLLTRNLAAVEGLGRIDTIILDKTGTLTTNELMVCTFNTPHHQYSVTGSGYCPDGVISDMAAQPVLKGTLSEEVRELLTAVALTSNAEITYRPALNRYEVTGNVTEAALAVAAQKGGIDKTMLAHQYRSIIDIPFDPVERIHVSVFEYLPNATAWVYVVGSPESMLTRITVVSEEIHHALQERLNQGLRTVMVAKKNIALPLGSGQPVIDAQSVRSLIATDLVCLGLCGIQDTIREDAYRTIAQLRTAGVRVLMATGDHAKTALHIAKQVGLVNSDTSSITGIEMNTLSDQELYDHMQSTVVYARLTPDQKLRMVNLLRTHNNLVAMTGDGINDAPSLQAADIGIAMGAIGTEVAKQAADMVLIDDCLTALVDGVKQGRQVFIALRRTMVYFFSTNLGELFIVLFALISGGALPITAAQILWLNLVTDGFLNVALSMEPIDENMLPKKYDTLIDLPLVSIMLLMALPMGFLSLIMFSAYVHISVVYARTVALTTMVFFQLYNAWNCRSQRDSLTMLSMTSNHWLTIATAMVFGLHVAIVQVPFLQHIFNTTSLAFGDWVCASLVASSIIGIEEVRKWIMRSKQV